MKRLFTIILLLFIILMATPVYAQNTTSSLTRFFYDGNWHDYDTPLTSLQVNGQKLETDVPPIIFNDRSVVPARAVFEELGAKVSWDGSKSVVTVAMNNTDILLTINEKNAIVNGKKHEMDIPAKIINDRTMIPVRFVAEALGMKVDWQASQRLITIDNTTDGGKEAADDVQIGKVDYLVKDNNTRIAITASTAIGEYSSFEMDDHPRLVIDIKNAVLNIENKFVDISNNNAYKVRYSQYEVNPNITRFVIDLKTWTSYNIQLSDDKKQLYVEFNNEISKVNDISFVKSSSKEAVSIKMDSFQKPNISRLSNPDRVIIDIPLSKLDLAQKVVNVNRTIIESIRFAQFNENTVRVVVDVEGQPQFEVEEMSDELIVKFFNPKYKNLYYDNNEVPQLVINSGKAASGYKEQIDGNQYTISIPSKNVALGEGRLFINDTFLDFIDIIENTQTGMTDIVFHAKKLYKYTLQAK
ncbi:MAG: stalk domain-containing protein, partial [Clostridia bacterium]